MLRDLFRHRIFCLTIIFLTLVLIISCSRERSKEPEGEIFLKITDDLNCEVVLTRPPQRIICLSPEAAETIAELGRVDLLSAVVTECDYPEDVSSLPKVGSFSNPAYEKILSFEPDLVIATGLEQEDFTRTIRNTGIPVMAIYSRTIEDVENAIMLIGRITQSEEKARDIVAGMEEKFTIIEEALSDIPRNEKNPRVYVEISPDPLMTVAEGSFVHEVIELTGGVNIGYDLPREYSRIDPELVIARDPDYIIVLHSASTVDEIVNRTGWEVIEAVREGNIITNLNPDLLLRASPRLADGAIELFNAIHPGYEIDMSNGMP